MAVAAYPLIAKNKRGMCHNKDAPLFCILILTLSAKRSTFFVKRVDLFRKKGLPFYYKERLFLQRAMLVTTKNEDASGLTHPRLVIYPLLGLS